MRIVYIADDGKEFDNENDCEEYEGLLQHPHLDDIIFFDEYGNKFDVHKYDNAYDDRIYDNATVVYITDKKVLNDFLWLVDQCGWCEFEQITSPGDWYRTSGEYPTDQGTWHKWEGKAE